ncbi:MAG: MHS family MFS transporter [Inquilinus limosus]|uniref:MHS family MFS transporter n=1 Tax=Inquilinus limosus TaxID=171674 RepID=A0A952FRU3_9PROT|nr:MHS family MFS transporter [Inquilinus limosus]
MRGTTSDQGPARQPVRAAAAAFIGTAVEFYDFYVYGLAVPLALGPLFFPSDDPFVSTLAAFGTFAVGFIARPIGGVVFGHLGDRLGRKKLLVFTMLLMGFATIAIGCLPTYAQIGIWAPVLLVVLRIVQGLATSGEWGGAVLMAGEHAPAKRVTFFASFAQLGSPAGLLLALLMFRAVKLLDPADFMAWGWRIPFLAGVVLLGVGFAIRASVRETPAFEKVVAQKQMARFPVAEALRTAWYPILLAAGVSVLGTGGFFFTNVFMISYTTTYVGVPEPVILDCLLWVTVIQFLSQPVSALLAERIGEVRFLKLAAFLAMLAPYPMFLLVGTGQPLAIVFGISLAIVTLSGVYAVMAGFLSTAFPARLRYSCISMGYQLGVTVSAGGAPLLGAVIARQYQGQWLPLALFFSVLALVTLASVHVFMLWRRGYEARQAATQPA